MALIEKPRRLPHRPEVLRDLYLKSGNMCAFPGCVERFVNADGQLVGDICHVEAAMPGGERFNPNMTNEQRRAFENLILLCRTHHATTNEVTKYTVEAMKEMKERHEAKFSGLINRMASIIDEADVLVINPARNLEALRVSMGETWEEEDRTGYAEEVAALAERLRKVPQPTREIAAVLVERSEGKHVSVPFDEVRWATGVSQDDLSGHAKLLEKYGFGGFDDDGDGTLRIHLSELKSGWDFWGSLRAFCKSKGRSARAVVVDMDFSVLD